MKKSLFTSLLDTAGACLAITLIATVAVRVTVAGLDRNQTCVSNLSILGTAATQYAQDYDELLPPYTSYSAFTQLIKPYALGANPILNYSSVIVCPATRNSQYAVNMALVGKPLTTLGTEADSTQIFSDSVPHPDGLTTVAFADGHVERGGVDQLNPDAACIRNEQRVYNGIFGYMQDHFTGTDIPFSLPATTGDTTFQSEVTPYTFGHKALTCPDTQQFYTLNTALNGQTLNSVFDWSTTFLVQDSQTHSNGKTTTTFLDGHIEQGGVEQPDAETACHNRLAVLALSIIQDSNTSNAPFALPASTSDPTFQAAEMAKLHQSRLFLCPATGFSYLFNTAINGLRYSEVPNPASTILVRDAVPHSDGLITVAYVDGHVVRIHP